MSDHRELHPGTQADLARRFNEKTGRYGCGCDRHGDLMAYLCEYHDGFNDALCQMVEPGDTVNWVTDRYGVLSGVVLVVKRLSTGDVFCKIRPSGSSVLAVYQRLGELTVVAKYSTGGGGV